MSSDYGVITEQGFVSGNFGFSKLNEEDEKTITKNKDNDKENKTNNKK